MKTKYVTNLWIMKDKGFETEKIGTYNTDSYPPVYPEGTSFRFHNNPMFVKETKVSYNVDANGTIITHDILLRKGE